MSFPAPTTAYDLEMLTRPYDRGANDHGWTFGLPPGIPSWQWPLDPVSGYPLMHGFTLLLPPDYRIHGPDIVALSFFATSADQNDGVASSDEDLREAIVDGVAEIAEFEPFAEHARQAHPRLHRFTDVIGYEYALILLTEAEFTGAPPAPPLINSPILARSPKPEWLEIGAAASFYRSVGVENADERETQFGYRILGGPPARTPSENRAIRWTPRDADPNAGKAPDEDYAGTGATGYTKYYYWENGVIHPENFREHGWAKGHKPDHIGGTMRPVQGIPSMSPFYIEFEEYFGGYNFGGGNAQLDFRDMIFDWACG